MHHNQPNWNDIHVVVINLAKDGDRRSYMERELEELAIPYVFLEATDGKTYDFNGIYDESVTLEKNGRPLTLPEKGCALSHRRALESFLSSGKPYGLILEDDVAIDKKFTRAVLESINARNKKPWTYLQFNYSPVGWRGAALWWFLLLRNRQTYSLPRLLLAFLKGFGANILSLLWGIRDRWYRTINTGAVCRLVRDQYLAGCYTLTREAAQALIDLNTPLAYTADRIQNIARRNGKITHRVYVPRLVRQKRESFSSSINNEHFGKKVISY